MVVWGNYHHQDSNQTLSVRQVAASSSYASAPDSQRVSPKRGAKSCGDGLGTEPLDQTCAQLQATWRRGGDPEQRRTGPRELRGRLPREGSTAPARGPRPAAPPSPPRCRHSARPGSAGARTTPPHPFRGSSTETTRRLLVLG